MEAFNIRVIEAMEIPEQHEADFLRDIADKLGLQFPHDSIFTERLAKDNLDFDWLGIAKSLNPNVTEEEERLKLAENTRKTWSKEICNTLKQWGFSYKKGDKKLWLSARQWLAQTQYGSWLWEQLSQQSQRTQQMGFIEAPETLAVANLGARREPSKDYKDQVGLNSEVILEINLTAAAHLTLLEREPNGTVVCLCPSEYAPNTLLSRNIEKIPQESAPYPTFAATELGQEQWIALLTPQSPPFQWLKQSRWEAMELQLLHLQEVFEYVKTNQARLLYTEYEVV
ncbi:DUF4384 domain-containing protein [Lyngbya sp. CCY1209]|uniref:DUF4384 domain-containing protein n=1 Tax=Lyngbya sp. CCY1209 TaxID=2886103 RepID=UPI002D20C1DB|nr:DUF4384 domain-containing protein [Lyngbya sp. CCY1209]MEB3886482.1 DUF4384 domain-containing protein [Lyngbya sp. CCY1209]